MQGLASRIWPLGWHPGGLGWALARNSLAEEIVVYGEDHDLVGWAGLNHNLEGVGHHPPEELFAQVDPSRPEVARAIVEWILSTAKAQQLTIEVAQEDDTLLAALEEAGFSQQAEAGPVYGMRRPALARAPAPPDGYTVRAVEPSETAARVQVHRAAWRPASLPWHPDHQAPIDPEATSSFTEEHYESVRQAWLYDPELDLVAVAPDGNLAACCIAWFDPATGVAEIEPLGVAPEHRRRGLAGALCLQAAARVGATGGEEIFINTGHREEYPAPAGAYAKAGFELFTQAGTYGLRRS